MTKTMGDRLMEAIGRGEWPGIVIEGEEKRFDPNQPRDPGGEGGGRWIRAPGAAVVERPETDGLGARDLIQPSELGGWQPVVDDAVAAVDEVHRYPEGTRPTEVKLNSRLRWAYANFSPYDHTITLNPKEATPDARMILHELGHKLDETLASKRLSYASKEARRGGTPAMKKLVKAFRASDAYKRIGKSEIIPSGQLSYWRSSHEMFARAYAQFIAQRAAVSGSWESFEYDNGTQWEAEDFKPIAAAMEGVLQEQGLLK